MFDIFDDAWWFLYKHPMFQNEYGDSKFEECLDANVAKINPLTCSIAKDGKLNTKTGVWIETGKYDKKCRWHDVDLDCGGENYEKAIINLANKVLGLYGHSKDRIKLTNAQYI